MNYARWYPTLAEMGNGMVMAMSGLNQVGQITMNSEMFNPRTNTWTVGPVHGFPTYPATFLTENGQLFFTGSNAGYGPSTPGLAHARVSGTSRPKPSAPVPGIPSAAGPGDQRLGAAAARPETDDHGAGRRRRRPVQVLHRAHGADRHRGARPALGARAEPGRSRRATRSPCCCPTTRCW